MKTEDHTFKSREDYIGWFGEKMEEAFARHDGEKEGWDDIDIGFALSRLREEVIELEKEVQDELVEVMSPSTDPDKVIREAADVANFALMIALKMRDRGVER